MSVKIPVNAESATNAFSGSLKGKSIIQVQKLSGDASSREYFRVSFDGKETAVLQTSTPWSEKESAEHPFLLMQSILKQGGLPVPSVLAKNHERGWILLEDLGDQMLQDVPTMERYRKAIDFIVQMQKQLSKNQQVKLRFDFEKLFAEMKYTQEHLLRRHWNFSEAKCEEFAEAVRSTCLYLADRSHYFTHRDYHARNLMCHAQEIYLIDFQDARLGPRSYDVVSLVWDPYSKLSLQERESLMKYWHEATGDGEDVRHEEARMKIQRFLKAAGSYASFLYLKGREDYLKYIAPAMETVKTAFSDLKTYNKYNEDDRRLESLLWPHP